ncbi:MAG TPA: hypothetical protein VG960_00355 [Caulobacteraceae bacterium]|nr:hypothetical protein [Caulobacteraceae bacterium]
MSYREVFGEHLRLTILRVLAESPTWSANDAILKGAAVELGIAATRDQVRTELAWLSEQRLVATHMVGELTVATATERGLDVAAGQAFQPGVARPTPRP